MITNLFSSFDPSSSFFSSSWTILLFLLIMTSSTILNFSSSFQNTNQFVINTFNNETRFSLGGIENGVQPILITLFSFIITINFLALYPHLFATSSHLTITIPLSLISWLSIVTFGWLNNTNHILSHLLPEGTPVALINFIVIIELVSNIIRPLTLCVRLTANIIAGHLLITLLGNTLLTLTNIQLLTSLVSGILLSTLESAVACIQAYVFITLITLYITEVN